MSLKDYLPGDKKNNKTIKVNHPKDHPDVQNIADKKYDKMKKKIFGGVGMLGDNYKKSRKMDAKATKEAKKFMDTVQTMKSKKMSEKMGSFAGGASIRGYGAARTSGMGLQDESIQPGKVMKARVGRSVTRIPLAGKATSVGSTTMKGMKFSDKAKMVDSGKINKATGKFTSMEALRESIGYRPGESTDKFNKRRMALAAAKKTASASRIGKIALGIGAAGVAAQQYLKSKMNKKKDVKKKMGGGMMKKYSVGGGADSGNVGEMKSRIAVTIDRLKKAHKNTMGRRSGPMGNRLTDNDMEKIKNLVGKNKAARPIQKKMGGGMMKKPMGYKDGTKPGAGPLGRAGRAAGLGALGAAAAGKKDDASILASYHKAKFYDGPTDTAKDTVHPMKAQRHFMDSKKYRQKKAAKKMYETGEDKAGNKTSNTKSAQYFRDMNSPKTIKRAKEDFFKPFKEKRMYKSGGSVKGYRTGTMVKARGCKLGRTRPTKIT